MSLYEWESNYDDDEYHDDDIMTFRCEMARAVRSCFFGVNGVGLMSRKCRGLVF